MRRLLARLIYRVPVIFPHDWTQIGEPAMPFAMVTCAGNVKYDCPITQAKWVILGHAFGIQRCPCPAMSRGEWCEFHWLLSK